MIIRSQDKKRITEDLNLSIAHIQGIYEILDGARNTIGEYSTEEKAIKVLDDICAFANGLHFETIAIDQCGRLDGVVFQMPQDSEV